MFRTQTKDSGKGYQLAIVGLFLLSISALGLTLWIMYDSLKEQQIVAELMKQLPPETAKDAKTLAGDLRWQFRLAILVVLNLVVTGFAIQLLWNAYRTSQRTLQHIKALASDILTSVDQAIITTDLNGLITSMNRRAFELLDTGTESVNRPLGELSQNIPLESLWKRSPFKEGRSHSETSSPFPAATFRLSCQPLRSHQEEIIGSVIQIRDITEQALMEDRLRRIERFMGLDSLAAGLHHEIKNPLAALSLHVQLLDEQLEQESSVETRETLGIIRSEVNRVGGVLENFRDYASIDRLNLETVDINDLVRQQVELVRPQAEDQGIVIEVTPPINQAAMMIEADRIRLEQVLLNLVLNGMEAMAQAGILTISVQPDGNGVTLSVSDTGPGIPANVRDQVFDPYFTTKNEGTGMGLAVCDKIARQHNGNLEFSTSSEGTTFQLSLPNQQPTSEGPAPR